MWVEPRGRGERGASRVGRVALGEARGARCDVPAVLWQPASAGCGERVLGASQEREAKAERQEPRAGGEHWQRRERHAEGLGAATQ